MKKIIILIFLTFSFNSHSATMEDSCNAALSFLKQVGFNFTDYRSLKPFRLSFFGGVSCVHTNTGNLIHFYTSPTNRIFVFDEFLVDGGYCVQLTGRYEKTTRDSCY